MNTNTWEFLRRNPSITPKNCLENSPKQLGMIQGGESPFKGFVGISGDMKPLMVVVVVVVVVVWYSVRPRSLTPSEK